MGLSISKFLQSPSIDDLLWLLRRSLLITFPLFDIIKKGLLEQQPPRLIFLLDFLKFSSKVGLTNQNGGDVALNLVSGLCHAR